MAGKLTRICLIFIAWMVWPVVCYAAKPTVVATTTIIYDITRHLAKEHVQLVCLMPVGGDPHIYEPTPADARKIADCDLVLKNGLHLEGWLDELILNAGGSHPIVDVSEGIQAIRNTQLHSSPDPHAWMDPLLGIEYARNIRNALIQLDASHASDYEQAFDLYREKLQNLHEYIQKRIAQIPVKKRVLITSHDAFRYYGRRYGIRVESALGTSTDADVQTGDILRLIQVIDNTGVKAVFVESTLNPKLMQQLASDHGVSIGGKLFADSIGDEESGAGTYLDMLRHNTDVISAALQQSEIAEKQPHTSIPTLLISVGLLLVAAFGWLYFRLKTLKQTDLNWDEYLIEVKNLTVAYHRKTVLTNISFELESGRLYGLLGPNGAGKSTLFKSILGLVKPDTGTVLINGTPVENVRKKIAYIPQKEEIDWSFPATVLDVVLTGRIPHKKHFETYRVADRKKAMDALHRMGMDEFTDRQIGDLSGGQQQRVFIARALCQDAEVLMFDEPFVGVDITSEEKIIQIIRGLVEEKKTVIIIHHDLSKVKDYFDSVIMINQRLIAAGPTLKVFTNENISKTYSGRLAILQETDKYLPL